MALTSALAVTLEPPAIVGLFDHCLFGSFQEFDAVDASVRQRIYASPASLPTEAKLVAGHIALSTLRQAYPRAQVITILREPISRLLSHWLYWRQHSDAALMRLGAWGDRARCARQPLASFLSQPLLACQIDNLALRMLLWPHSLIPANRFIDPADDERLIMEATVRLRSFNFVDILENDNFVQNLQCWLGRPLAYDRHNETGSIPEQFRSPLNRELTSEAHELLVARSRLDLRLWAEIAGRRLPGRDISALRERIMLANVARYGVLMGSPRIVGAPDHAAK